MSQPGAFPRSHYVGRFAPSPTGPLHAGSLAAALASYLDARAAGGKWYVRLEDLDPPRETPEAARQILHSLEVLGLHWDGEVLYQSSRQQAYREALEALARQDLIFPCDCSRQQIQVSGGVYPGTCRGRKVPPPAPYALRCQVPAEPVTFKDLFQGPQCWDLSEAGGDFIVLRKDGFYAYQLAVTVDDAWQNITHVIRGIDLLDSTPRQIYLQRCLSLATPQYGHIPIVVNNRGQKLSKQHFAAPLDLARPQQALLQALGHLRQFPEPALERGCNCEEILDWAREHWNPAAFRGLSTIDAIVRSDTPGV